MRRVFLFLLMFYTQTDARHLDTDRDYSTCPDGQIPWAITNNDGFLKVTCVIPRCDEIKKVKPVCSPTYSSGCTKGNWVSGLQREFQGEDEKAVYKTRCCSHPIFQKTVAVKPHADFQPGAEAKDPSVGQGETIDIVTNVMPNPQYDHHTVEITTVYCGQSSTTKPTTPNPNNDNNNENCGPTGCSQPKLEGGSKEHYEKQNVPLPGKPPVSASDPKEWGIDMSPRGAGGGGAGCFSADTLVHTRRGEKRMDELQVGDEILSSASWDGNSALAYQPITQFIHKDPSILTRYTVISTQSGHSLSLTPYHLLPQFDCHLLQRQSVSVREYELLFNQWARYAKRARAGQCVLVVNSEGKFTAERINNVTWTIRQGVFSPITASGIIVANGVQASCYSSVENHAIQHAFFTVIHKINQALKPYFDTAKQIFTGQDIRADDNGQIPILLRIMLMLSELVMGSF